MSTAHDSVENQRGAPGPPPAQSLYLWAGACRGHDIDHRRSLAAVDRGPVLGDALNRHHLAAAHAEQRSAGAAPRQPRLPAGRDPAAVGDEPICGPGDAQHRRGCARTWAQLTHRDAGLPATSTTPATTSKPCRASRSAKNAPFESPTSRGARSAAIPSAISRWITAEMNPASSPPSLRPAPRSSHNSLHPSGNTQANPTCGPRSSRPLHAAIRGPLIPEPWSITNSGARGSCPGASQYVRSRPETSIEWQESTVTALLWGARSPDRPQQHTGNPGRATRPAQYPTARAELKTRVPSRTVLRAWPLPAPASRG